MLNHQQMKIGGGTGRGDVNIVSPMCFQLGSLNKSRWLPLYCCCCCCCCCCWLWWWWLWWWWWSPWGGGGPVVLNKWRVSACTTAANPIWRRAAVQTRRPIYNRPIKSQANRTRPFSTLGQARLGPAIRQLFACLIMSAAFVPLSFSSAPADYS